MFIEKMFEKINGALILETGDVFYGTYLNNKRKIAGEVCFTTAMTGYQESITDPSYKEQILVFSFPHIGITGTNNEDEEGKKPLVKALIMGTCELFTSNYRSKTPFKVWLTKNNISGLSNINTRDLIKLIARAPHPLKAFIIPITTSFDDCKKIEYINKLKNVPSLKGNNNISYVYSPDLFDLKEKNVINPKSPTILIVDFGCKRNITRILVSKKCRVIKISPNSIFEKIMNQYKPSGFVLSNGPGDPQAALKNHHVLIKKIMDSSLPILGICLGFQIIALYLGANTKQLITGHHGINHPVKSLKSCATYITSQNHEFIVDENTLPFSIVPTFKSLFDGTLEGFEVKDKNIIAVQFHPEGCPGPTDTIFIFDEFLKLVHKNATKK